MAPVRRGWHAVGMTDMKPENPQIDDVWINDDGEMERFDGTSWQPYNDVPDGPPLEPHIVVREEAD